MIKLLIILFYIFPAFANDQPKKIVNVVGCSIFDSNGKILKKYLGWVCAFFPNGNMILGDGFTLTFYDPKMNPIWSKDVHTNYIAYSEEDQTGLVIASNIIKDTVRLDRLEIYDKNGKLQKHFDFQKSHSLGSYLQTWDMPAFPKVKEGITLIDAFYRIDKNSSKLAWLKEGNYVANEAFGKIYIFDSRLQKIVHSIDTRKWDRNNLRDVQVISSGNFLVYNSGNIQNGTKFTTLEELDPHTGNTVWAFRASPPTSFYGDYQGNVQRLTNGNLLYSVIMDEKKGKERVKIPDEEFEKWMAIQGAFRAFEVTRDGKKVWSMVNDGSNLSGMPNVVKRLDLTSYFQHKGRF